MRYLGKFFWMTLLALLLVASGTVFAAARARTINLPAGGTSAVIDDDDEEPDVKARVARISFIRGEVKIKRVDNDQWEKAVLNLPLVEGDEIATGTDARVELQFNNYVYVRLDADAYLKMTTLSDKGVAVSLTQGTLGLRITDLDKARGFFEIDAAKTTLAIEKSGTYRVDAGHAGDKELRVTATGGGSARVYSETAGFTLKSGRSSRVFLDGANDGDWETADASANDEFDTWADSRDSMIAKKIKSAYYDKYYDEDIFGADDLDGYGEWVYTSTYGYVWRPYDTALAGYVDWSPYRYGHWRWVSPFGWTWVNDEPWGWATYHHGRWVFDHGHWVWCPYSYYRPKRSWWFPAIVAINIINTDICWYPLPWHHRWHNYNNHNNGHPNGGGWNGGNGGGNGGGHGSGGNGGGGSGGGNGGGTQGGPLRLPGRGGGQSPPWVPPIIKTPPPGDTTDDIPTTGIIVLPGKDFGDGTTKPTRLDTRTATTVLTGPRDTVVDLPDRNEVYKRNRDIIVRRPTNEPVAENLKTGATTRRSGEPLDEELRTTRIFGGRKPVPSRPDVGTSTQTTTTTSGNDRGTGAVEHPKGEYPSKTTIRSTPIVPTRIEPTRSEPTKGDDKPKYQTTTKTETPRQGTPYIPPTRTEAPKQQEQPRNDPKPPPPPTPKSDPPPTRTEPKRDDGEPSRGKVKDGK